MANISNDDVREVARLSGFALSGEEIQAYREQFQDLIAYFEELGQVDTDGVEPTYQVTGLQNTMREDEVIDYGVSKPGLLKNTAEQEDGQIKVRRVL